MPESAEEKAAREAAEAAETKRLADEAAAAAAAAANPPPPATGEDQLGDAGKRAIAAERQAAATAKAEAAALRAELEELKRTTMSDSEKALDAAKIAGRNEATATLQAQILRTEVRVAAAGKMKNPADAAQMLDLSKFTVAEDGTVDTKAIESAIDELVKDKPYLAGATPAGSGDGGARGNPADKPVTREDLAKMSSAEIEALRKAGKLDHLLTA